MSKACKSCSEVKNFEDFYGRGDKKGSGIQSHCKVCVRERRRLYVVNNPNSVRNTDLKMKYGITLEDYNSLFSKQSGRCAICNRHQTEVKRTLHLDHCHLTGKVRGLLCANCNTALGKFQDNLEILLAAINYIGSQK